MRITFKFDYFWGLRSKEIIRPLFCIAAMLMTVTLTSSASMQVAGPPDRKIIFISGLGSHSYPGEYQVVNDWLHVRIALYEDSEVQARLSLQPEDFLYFSYRGFYYGNNFSQPLYNPDDTCNYVGTSASHLDDLIKSFPNSEFDIITHSLGGVVAAYWAAEIADNCDLWRVHSIITLDSPLKGVVSGTLCDVFAPSPCAVCTWDLPANSDVIASLPQVTSKIALFTIRNSVDFAIPWWTATLDDAWRDYTAYCEDLPSNHSCVRWSLPVLDEINEAVIAEAPFFDTTPPDGGFRTPDNGAVVGNSVYLSGWAGDYGGSGVAYVNFTASYDGAWHLVHRDEQGPYEYNWDLSGIADQTIELGFDIYDKAENYTWSPHGTRMILKDATPPDGAYTSPSNDARVGDSVFLQGWATDNLSGVDYVNFTAKYDGSWHTVHTDHSSPYEYTWDLSGIADQAIELGFDIYDKAGNYVWSPHGTIQIVKDTTTTPTPTPTPGSDTIPPTNPTSCVELNGAQNNVWQSSIGHPVFVWSGADGTGSDIAGYYHTFSTDPNGTSDYFTTNNTFDFDFSTGWPTGVPYYLRVRTKDTSGNLATGWKTIFTFRYDPVPPTVSFDRANGISISTGQDVCGNVTNWTFEGTANDSGAGLDSIVFGAWGNNYGAGWNDTAGTSSPWSYSQNGLSGHNRIHFWATDEANNVSERQYIELYVDSVSPSTGTSVSGTMGDNRWYRSHVQVALFATDYGSGGSGTIGGVPNHYIAGVGYTRYRIDGGSWQTYSSSFSVSGDGTHTVDYYSVDAVGNEESARSLTIKVDTNPPSGSLSINRGASTSYSLNVILGPSASDGSGSGVSQMRFSNSSPDWGEWEAYAPERAWRLTDGSGSKTVYVQFQDTAGNISEYSVSIFVDLYPDKPASQNYRVFKSVVGIGGGSKGSANYKAGNTTGQPAIGPAPERSQSSESFRLATGYWAMQPWPLFGDFNHDCRVGVEDIMRVASRWRTSCAKPDPDNDVNTPNYEKMYDIDHDCDINIVDIMKVVVHWGETCP